MMEIDGLDLVEWEGKCIDTGVIGGGR